MPYPRKPDALKRLQGNPGKRPLGKALDGAVLAKVPNAPTWLDDEARKFFRGMGRECIAMGLLTQADIPALTMLAVLWGRWLQAERELAARGPVITTATGATVINPWQTVSNRALDKFADLLAQFGGTPAARTKFALENEKPFGAEDFRALLLGRVRAEHEPQEASGWHNPVAADKPDADQGGMSELRARLGFKKG